MRNVCPNINCLKKNNTIIVLLGLFMIVGCTEPFDLNNENIEDLLVVNARITDEITNQKILVSRTIGFEEEDTPIQETGATIIVTEEGGVEYEFNETAPGVYESVQPFGVTGGKTYQLFIETRNQKKYKSENVIAPISSSDIDVYTKRMVNDGGVDGVGVFLNSFDPSGNSNYYKFEYEETHKIVAPLWVSFDITSDLSTVDEVVSFDIKPRPLSQQVCYKTQRSININTVNTTNLTEDRIQDLLINFIPAADVRVAERYSILVNQYVQTLRAQSFYNVLGDFSQSDNIFSQIQPGFISGNIFPESNSDENVVGLFDVSIISSRRLFFDRRDVLEDVPYVWDCEEFIPEFEPNPNIPLPPDEQLKKFLINLHGLIREGTLRMLEPIPWTPVDPGELPDNLILIPRACGDCTALGRSEVPDFWIE